MQVSPITLLFDLGNTRLKIAVWRPGDVEVTAIDAHPHADLGQLLEWLSQTLDAIRGEPVHAYGVSVAGPNVMQAIESLLTSRHPSLSICWVWPQAQSLGVINAYPDPSQLGADRWAAMLGLMQRFGDNGQSIVLANFGTATTVDTLSRDRRFLGGLIFPGVSMMQTSLSKGTARLPLAQGEVNDYPTDTHGAITTGIVAAQLGGIRRQIELSTRRDGVPPVMCVSGGAWSLLKQEWHRMLPGVAVQETPHVVLEGLLRFARMTAHL